MKRSEANVILKKEREASRKGGSHSGGDDAVATSAQLAQSELIYVRVRQDVLLPVLPLEEIPVASEPPSAGHLYLIQGTLEDVQRYAGTTVDWVIKIAQLICDPLRPGKLYTHTTDTASEWYNLDRTSSWRQVVSGDSLLAGIYEFEPINTIQLSRISERNNHSVTSQGSKLDSTAFRDNVIQRDGDKCVVTKIPESLIASHLIPKRLGSDGAKDIVNRFVGAEAADDVHRFDPRIGILLVSTLDNLVDNDQLGFYQVTGNTYVIHNFYPGNPDLNLMGCTSSPIIIAPPLHCHQVTFAVHEGDVALPPRGIFDWHYLQCVTRVFATEDYRNYPNIRFHEYPFKTQDEIDDEYEYTDNHDADPPYPTYRFDRFREQHLERQAALLRNNDVANWVASIPPDTPSDMRPHLQGK